MVHVPPSYVLKGLARPAFLDLVAALRFTFLEMHLTT